MTHAVRSNRSGAVGRPAPNKRTHPHSPSVGGDGRSGALCSTTGARRGAPLQNGTAFPSGRGQIERASMRREVVRVTMPEELEANAATSRKPGNGLCVAVVAMVAGLTLLRFLLCGVIELIPE